MTAEITEKSDHDFYSDGANYWSEIPATIDGMLGGFGFISQTDIKGSKMFLKQLFNSKHPPGRKYALDCGAGIGRITKFLLTDLFEKVDLVEQNAAFLEQAKKYIGLKSSNVGNLYPVGLQNFQPEAEKYDIIWIQWVLGHLTDDDLINFLISCRYGLRPNGLIVIKENTASSDNVEMDRLDSSVTRPIRLLHHIFEKANLECYRQLKQHNFPKGLYSVYMFALKPKKMDECISDDLSGCNKNVTNVKGILQDGGILNQSQAENIQGQENFNKECTDNCDPKKAACNFGSETQYSEDFSTHFSTKDAK